MAMGRGRKDRMAEEVGEVRLEIPVELVEHKEWSTVYHGPFFFFF